MGMECGWRHARKRWSWEFENFEKSSVVIGLLRGELWVRPWRVGFWLLKDVVGFFGSLSTEILNITRCAARWGGVSKNCVSLLVSPWTEVKKYTNFLVNKSSGCSGQLRRSCWPSSGTWKDTSLLIPQKVLPFGNPFGKKSPYLLNDPRIWIVKSAGVIEYTDFLSAVG